MDQQVKIAVIGAGSWGRNHIKTLYELNTLGAIIESDQKVQNELESLYPNTIVDGSINETLVAQMDGVVIATPPPSHFDLTKHVISMGKPVLVEKPLVLSMKEAEALKLYVKEFAGRLMVGHLLLFHPAIIKMKLLLEEGFLGDLQYIYSNRLNLGKVRKNENVFWSFAPHDISIFQFMLNELPLDVTSVGGAFLQDDIHDTSITYFKYPSGVQGHIFVNWLHPFKEHRLVLIGSKGSLHFEDSKTAKPLIYYEKNNGDSPLDLNQSRGELIEYENEMPLTNELKYFINCIRGAPIEKANIDSGIEVIKILELASNSLTTKSKLSPISKPPKIVPVRPVGGPSSEGLR